MRLITAGPDSREPEWPLLQRVRWRFVLLNLVAVVLSPLNLVRIADGAGEHMVGYAAATAAFGVWAVALYRSAGQPRWLDAVGPVLIAAIGVASGHHLWAFGFMYMALLLHSLYGQRRRALRNAGLHMVAYQVAVLVTEGRAELLSDQLMSNTLAGLVMSWVMIEMASSLRRSDAGRRRDDALLVASRRLLRASSSPDEVARAAAEGLVGIVTLDGTSAHRITVWRRTRDELTLAAIHGAPLNSDRVDLRLMPSASVAGYLDAQPVRLDPDQMREAQRLGGGSIEPGHGLAFPLTDGQSPIGLLFLHTADALDGDTLGALQRFADEVSLGMRAADRNQLLAGVVDNSPDGILLLDDRCEVTFASPTTTELVGRDDLVGRPLGDVLVVAEEERAVTDLTDLSLHAASLAVRRVDGSLLEVEVSSRAIAGEGTVLNLRDVSEQRQLQREIAHRAHYDAVTGLPNRSLFLDRLHAALDAAARVGSTTAVALLDLDNFKAVNDRLGHLTGDRILCHVAERVRERVRASDTFARLGGDEFALLIEDVDGAADVRQLLDEVLAVVRRPVIFDGREVVITASCGIVVSSGDRSAEEVLGDADLAMYAAKDAGKDSAVVFDPQLRVAALECRQLRDDLEAGIGRDELRLHYQPLLSLAGGTAVGAEALVRWEHPSRGLLGPDRFITLAEDTGLIGKLGRWVLAAACRDLADWVAQGVVDETFQLHVNLSAHQLSEQTLAADVEAMLRRFGLRASQLVLEVTETALAHNPEVAEQTLHRLHRLGIGIAIDDFGTGYASFTYLRRFPVDVVKIDRSFVAEVTDGPDEAALAHAIVSLARMLGMVTVAEGIEDETCRDLLAGWGCDHAQGWLWSPALPRDELGRWFSERACVPSV